jgi:hypothetical protein
MAFTEKSPPPLEMTPAPCYLQRVTGSAPILTGSKKMSPQQQEELMQVSTVRVLIVDGENPGTVLVDEITPAKEFSTGSVGYGLNLRDCTFLTS